MHKLSLKHLAIIIALFLLQGCGGTLLKEADSFNSLTQDEVIVVGSIELFPKFSTTEQSLHPDGLIDVLGYGNMHANRVIIQFNDKPEVIKFKTVINPELDKLFYFKVPHNMNHMVEAYILTSFTHTASTSSIMLPMWFKINIKPGDKAVYIGNIEYTRDEFDAITKIELKDNYRNAVKYFKKKFGKKYKLRKSLINKI